MYCAHCGNALPEGEAAEVHAEAEAIEVAEVASAEVRIAEINAERDIKLARISAGIIDAGRDTELARAEGKAEAFEEVLAPEPADAPEPQVVVVDAPAEDAPPVDDTDVPENDHHNTEQVAKSHSYGNPGWFGSR